MRQFPRALRGFIYDRAIFAAIGLPEASGVNFALLESRLGVFLVCTHFFSFIQSIAGSARRGSKPVALHRRLVEQFLIATAVGARAGGMPDFPRVGIVGEVVFRVPVRLRIRHFRFGHFFSPCARGRKKIPPARTPPLPNGRGYDSWIISPGGGRPRTVARHIIIEQSPCRYRARFTGVFAPPRRPICNPNTYLKHHSHGLYIHFFDDVTVR